MKNTLNRLLFIVLILGLIPLSLYSKKVCFCGSLADGITEFRVNGDKCCTSAVSVGSIARTTYYFDNGDGTYSLDRKDPAETAQDAQDTCCQTPT